MQYNRLGDTDMSVSALSFGASSLGSVFHETNELESISVVHRALEAGINYVDTAPWYGQGKSETVLGKALVGIPRSSYYLATKVGRYEKEVAKMFDFSAEKTLLSIDESLQRLGVEYVDVLQVHDMEFAPSLDIIINETLPAVQKIKESGKARYIGITGYPLDNFKKVMERSPVKIDTILSYCRYSLNDTALSDYLPQFKNQGIGIINAAPLSMGLLTHDGPATWHPATEDIKEACRGAAQFCQDKGIDLAKMAIYFAMANKDVDTTLFSTASMEYLEHNLEVTKQSSLSKNELEVLNAILERFFRPLNNHHWEGIEVHKYREAMSSIT